MLKSLLNFIKYWYFRYLLVTELYMVEKFERVIMHIFLLVVFTLITLFNNTVVLRLVANTTSGLFIHQENSIRSEL